MLRAADIINSGVIVASEIELEDRSRTWARGCSEVAQKTGEAAGDGTTTATVLAQSLVSEGLKHVAAGHDPMASSAASSGRSTRW